MIMLALRVSLRCPALLLCLVPYPWLLHIINAEQRNFDLRNPLCDTECLLWP